MHISSISMWTEIVIKQVQQNANLVNLNKGHTSFLYFAYNSYAISHFNDVKGCKTSIYFHSLIMCILLTYVTDCFGNTEYYIKTP